MQYRTETMEEVASFDKVEIFEEDYPWCGGSLPGARGLSASWPGILGGVLVLFAMGCARTPSRIAAPVWDPDGVADRAMKLLDKNGDGKLSDAELEAAPGLKYCAKVLDGPENSGDGDGQLSRDEIRNRIQLYRDRKVGYNQFTCTVLYNGRPLSGAEIRLVPEPFLGEGLVEPATGQTMEDGRATLDVGAKELKMPVVRIGMYRVEVTSAQVRIPPKYNTETTLGVEVPPVTDLVSPNGVVFKTGSR